MDIINPVNVRNEYAIFSTIPNDPLFHNKNFSQPIFCAGRIISFNQNVYNFKKDELVSYISHKQNLNISLSANLVFKLPNSVNLKQIAIIPYGSYAMKILREINPKLGHCYILIGLNFFSLLLEKLIKLTGAYVYIITTEDFSSKNRNLLDNTNIINGFSEFFDQFSNKLIESLIINNFQELNILKFQNTLKFKYKYHLKKISIFDIGYDDPNYKKGIEYPYSYIRWDYRENLKYFIYLIESEIIDLNS